ncbi:MAG: hypothetical protein QOE35_2945 [Actinomycetota bacterium]|jgi:hypothetical protein
MRKIVTGLVISACSLGFGFTGTAHADLKSDCNNGDKRACEQLAQQRCVDALRKEGFTKKAAQRECR